MGTQIVNPQIPLEAQAPRPSDPLEAYSRVMALKSALGQQQLQQQALQSGAIDQQTRQMQLDQMHAQNAIWAKAFKVDADGTPSIDQNALKQVLADNPNGAGAIPQVLENVTKYHQSLATLNKTIQESAETANKVRVQGQDAAGYLGLSIKQAGYEPRMALGLMGQAADSNPALKERLVPVIQQGQKLMILDPSGAKATEFFQQTFDPLIAQSPAAQEAIAKSAAANKANTEANLLQTKQAALKDLVANPAKIDAQIDSIIPSSVDAQANASYKASMRAAAASGSTEAVDAIRQAATSHAGQIAEKTNPGVIAAAVREAGQKAMAEVPAKVAAEFASIPAHVQQAVQSQLAIAKNSPEAFAGITDPIERHKAEDQFEKLSMDAAAQIGDSKKLQDYVAAAQSGNKAAGGLLPVVELRGIVNRVNAQELRAAGVPGDIIDKGIAALNGVVKGVPASPEGLKAMKELADVTQNSITNKYNAQVNVIKQVHGAKNLQPIDLQGAFSSGKTAPPPGASPADLAAHYKF